MTYVCKKSDSDDAKPRRDGSSKPGPYTQSPRREGEHVGI